MRITFYNMMSFKKMLSKIAILTIGALAIAPQTQAEDGLGLEAIVSPHFGFGITTSQGSRTYYGLDFHRISSNISLLAVYGYSPGHWDMSAILRFSRQLKLFDEGLSSGLYLGIGAGGNYSPGAPRARTNTARRQPYSDAILNPFIRYLFDFNGWQGLYIETAYQYHYRFYLNKTTDADLKAPGHIMLGIGISFEAERSRGN